MGGINMRWLKRGGALRVASWIASIRVPHSLLRAARISVNQANPERDAAMRAMIGQYFSSSASLLEIGSWFGEGSTRIWLDELPSGSDLILLDRWDSYVSAEDLGKGSAGYAGMDRFHRPALINTVDVVDAHPRRHEIDVSIIRSETRRIGRFLENAAFDVIYIDGSHYHDDVVADIEFAKKAIKTGFGIICGDDLEILPDAEVIEHARRFKERDFVAYGDRHFHPGVALAVAEQFGRVNMKDGFWWVFCRNGVFEADGPDRQV